MDIGTRIRKVREAMKVSQDDFAGMGGVGKRTQIYYEQGKRNPDARYLVGLGAKGVDILYILTGYEAPEDVRKNVSLMLQTTAAVEPSADGPLSEQAMTAMAGIAEDLRRGKLHRLLDEVAEEDLPMVEQLLERLTRR